MSGIFESKIQYNLPNNGNSWQGIAYGDGTFVAIAQYGDGNRACYSKNNGQSWTPYPLTNIQDSWWSCIAYGNGTFVAVAKSQAPNVAVTSTNGGASWTRYNINYYDHFSITFGQQYGFQAVGNNVVEYLYSNGQNGSVQNTGQNYSGTTYGNGRYVAVGYGISGFSTGIGINSINTNTGLNLNSVTYGNNYFVAVGNNVVARSTDGYTWTSGTSPVNTNWGSVVYGSNGTQSLFVAVGIGGGTRLMYSIDGLNWYAIQSINDGVNWRSVTYGNGYFVAIGDQYGGAMVLKIGAGYASAPTSITINGTTVAVNGTYTAIARTKTVNFVITPFPGDSVVSITGNDDLQDDLNTITITMTSLFGLQSSFNVYVMVLRNCFLEGTKILCYINNEEKYVPIEQMKEGTLVKTFLNGYIPVHTIGHSKIYNPANKLRSENRLYKRTKEHYPEITEDLIITGCHSVLVDVDRITPEIKQKTMDLFKHETMATDTKYRLLTCLDERSEPYEEEGTYPIWHFALDHYDIYMNYGVYANGLLVETCSINMMREHSGLEIV
jgi:hypothetical protein